MKKVLFFAIALMGAMVFTACNGDSKTPEGDTTKLWPAGENGSEKWGFMDKSGKLVIKADYDRVYGFSCGWALVVDGNDKTYIDKNGKSGKVPDTDTYYTYFYHDRISFKDGDLYGKWDNNFVEVIPADYKKIGMTADNGYCYYSEDGKQYGFLDKNGKVVVEEEFDYCATFDDGICVVGELKSDEMRYGIINEKGVYTYETQKDGLINLGEGRVAFYKASKEKYGIIDKNGNEILGATYDDIEPFSCGLAMVEKNDKCGYIGTNGDEKIAPRWAGASSFSDNVAWVQKDADSKIELIDKSGETLFKLKDSENPQGGFHNGLCLIYNYDSKKYYYIDKSNEKVYTWSMTDDDDDEVAPALDMQLNHEWMKATEYGPLFIDKEIMLEKIAR